MSNTSSNEGYVNGGETPRQRAEYYDAVIAASGQAATQRALEADQAYHTEAHPVD